MDPNTHNRIAHIEQDMLRLTVPELRQICRDQGYRGYSHLRKVQLVSFICQRSTETGGNDTKKIEPKTVTPPKSPPPKSPPPDCPICLEAVDEKAICMPCSHPLHFDCFVKLCRSSGSCPVCRDIFADKPELKEDATPIPDEIKREIAFDSLLNYFTPLVVSMNIPDEDRSTLATGALNCVRAGMDQVSVWFED